MPIISCMHFCGHSYLCHASKCMVFSHLIFRFFTYNNRSDWRLLPTSKANSWLALVAELDKTKSKPSFCYVSKNEKSYSPKKKKKWKIMVGSKPQCGPLCLETKLDPLRTVELAAHKDNQAIFVPQCFIHLRDFKKRQFRSGLSSSFSPTWEHEPF